MLIRRISRIPEKLFFPSHPQMSLLYSESNWEKKLEFCKCCKLPGHYILMSSIESIRVLLIKDKKDDLTMSAYKLIFQEISIMFLKYFCVNWIYGGKIIQKKAHLKFRFKILQRIQDPEHFTYLKTTFRDSKI